MKHIMKFLEENNSYLDCANDDINTTNVNGKLVARLLTSVSQNEIERTSERSKHPTYYTNVVEPIISKELWEECQVQKKKNSRAYQRTLTYFFYKN